MEVAGAGIEWAKENLNLFEDFKEFGDLISSVENDGNVVFISAFSGLFSPYWRNDVRGALLGLTQYTKKGHILRAVVNSFVMRCDEVLKCMEQDCGTEVT